MDTARFRNRVVLVLALSLTAGGACASMQAQDSSGPAGEWRGESICTGSAPACKDEKVVYHIPAPDASGHVTITADKVVQGRPVNMGAIEFQYDKNKRSLVSTGVHGSWRFALTGNKMTGTLTLPSGEVARRVSLSRP